MKKINPLVKFSSWIFILVGISELAVMVFLMMEGGTKLSDFFDKLFIESRQEITIFMVIIIIRILLGVLGLLNALSDVCLCLAFLLVFKDFIFMYYFYGTNIYVYLYRSIPELILVILYLLGRMHSRYTAI